MTCETKELLSQKSEKNGVVNCNEKNFEQVDINFTPEAQSKSGINIADTAP